MAQKGDLPTQSRQGVDEGNPRCCKNPGQLRIWEDFLDERECGETHGMCGLARGMMGLSRLAPGRMMKTIGQRPRRISSLSIDVESEASSARPGIQ